MIIRNVELYNKFKKFGNILSAKISIDEKHNLLHYGFVSFEKKEDAERALNEIEGCSK